MVRKLLAWYGGNKRELPWRATRDPYKIWISEIMLQQTRVDTVVDYYQRFIKRFPDVGTLAGADLEEVLAQWKGLGYYSRAKNLHRAARDILRHFGGVFPDNYAAVRALPGIGDYTAGAVMSIAYNQDYPAVDGNVLRVVARLEGMEEDISQEKTKKAVSAVVKEMIPDGRAGDFTQSLMELGALVCIPGTPDCSRCPVSESCTAYQKGLQEVLPIKKKKTKPSPEMHYWVAVIEDHHRLLMEYREHETLLGQMWGLPMAPKNTGVTGEQALAHRYGLALEQVEPLGVEMHVFTHRVWKMETARYRLEKGDIQKAGLQWVERDILEQLAVPTAFQKILRNRL